MTAAGAAARTTTIATSTVECRHVAQGGQAEGWSVDWRRHANHAHSVWRDPEADFGYDVLGAHLAEHHSFSLDR